MKTTKQLAKITELAIQDALETPTYDPFDHIGWPNEYKSYRSVLSGVIYQAWVAGQNYRAGEIRKSLGITNEL